MLIHSCFKQEIKNTQAKVLVLVKQSCSSAKQSAQTAMFNERCETFIKNVKQMSPHVESHFYEDHAAFWMQFADIRKVWHYIFVTIRTNKMCVSTENVNRASKQLFCVQK